MKHFAMKGKAPLAKLASMALLASTIVACDGKTIGVDGSSSMAMSSSSALHHNASSMMPNSSSTTSEAHSMMSHGHSSSAPEHHEFKAVISDFVGYSDWHETDYSIGATTPYLSGAHLGEADKNDDYMRKTFMNTAAYKSKDDREFAIGSIIIKETFTFTHSDYGLMKTLAPTGGLLAMVKRGGSTYDYPGGWEWFILDNDLKSVLAQGQNPADKNCVSCHELAGHAGHAGHDFVFARSEYEIDTHIFKDYQSWELIDYNTTPQNLDGWAHIDNADLRRTFQKQRLANPDAHGNMHYPTGTTLIKEITKDGKVEQLVAMVKRGGKFNPEGAHWEYFMLDPHDATKVVTNDAGEPLRGPLAGCNACHSAAKGEKGIDHVFKHSDAVFNSHAEKTEYIASNATFSNYKNWHLADYVLGNHNPFIGAAHGNAQPDYVRAVFQNEKAHKMLHGAYYPIGSVIIKETFSTTKGIKKLADAGGVLAMVKRGGSFNPDHNGWEWLELTHEGKISKRSAELKNGACNACHAKATGSAGIDYSFTKPSEVTTTIHDLKHFKTWPLIGDEKGTGSVHGGHNRKTYKKQGHASPYIFKEGEYPVGTTFVKQVFDSTGNTTRIVAMVKRGGNYDPANNDWEWFILNNDASSITSQGPSLSPTCTSCHAKAAANRGMDYVYPHANDPVPAPH